MRTLRVMIFSNFFLFRNCKAFLALIRVVVELELAQVPLATAHLLVFEPLGFLPALDLIQLGTRLTY